MNRKWDKNLIWPIASGVVLLLYLLLPFLYSLIDIPEGKAWSPLTSQVRQCGDFRLYYSGVNERYENFFVHTNPVSKNDDLFRIDRYRMATYQLMAFLGLGISDSRLSYLFSYCLSVLLLFYLIYALSRKLEMNHWASSLAGILVIFYAKISWIFYFSSPRYVTNYLTSHLLNNAGTMWLEAVNDSFRYMITGGADIYGFLIFIWFVSNANENKKFILLPLWALIVPFIYTPHTLLLTIMIAVYVLSQFRFSRKQLALLGLTAFVSMLVVYFIILPDYHYFKINGFGVIGQAHATSVTVTLKEKLLVLLKYTKYMLPLVILLFINRKQKSLFKLTLNFVISLMLLIVVMVSIGKIEILNRFTVRGFTNFWFFFFIIHVLQFLSLVKISESWNKLKIVLAPTIFITLLLIPTLGGIKIAKVTKKNEMFYLSEARLGVYQYLAKHAKPNEVAHSFDVEDIQLVPNFTHLNMLTPGAEYLEEPQGQLEKYVAAMRYLQLEPTVILEAAGRYKETNGIINCMKSVEQIEGTQDNFLLKQLIYDPYVKNFGNVKIRDKQGRIGLSFISEVNKSVAKVSEIDFSMVKYWIVKKRVFIDHKYLQTKFNILYKNEEFVIISSK